MFILICSLYDIYFQFLSRLSKPESALSKTFLVVKDKEVTMQEFFKNTGAFRVVNSFCRPVSRGNCRGTDQKQKIENCYPLPKAGRKRNSHTYSFLVRNNVINETMLLFNFTK